MGQRYRINKIKRMHSIIHGLLPILESMAQHSAITAITPGRISADKRPGESQITLQYYTDAGMKLLARSSSSVQEVFIVTSQPADVHAWLVRQKLIVGPAPGDVAGPVSGPASAAGGAVGSAVAGGGGDARAGGDGGAAPVRTAGKPKDTNTTAAGRPAPQRGKKGKKRRNRGREDDNRDYNADFLNQQEELLLADRIDSDAQRRLAQIRTELAAAEAAAAQAAAEKAAAVRKSSGKAGVKPAGKAAGAGKPATKPPIVSKKPANSMEEWLANTDDATFRKLARKNKDS